MHDDDDNDDDIDAIIHKFCAQQRILLEAEYLHPLEDSHTATTVLSHLMVQEVSIGLYGRTVVQFMRDVMLTTPNVHHQTTTTTSLLLLPAHSMTTGDDVDIRYTSSSTSTITTASSSSSPPGEVPNQKRRRIMSGVICEVTETSISVALSSSFSSPATNKKSSQSSTEENVDDDDDYVNDPSLRFTILPKSQRIIYERLLCALQQLPASSGRAIVRAMFQPTPAFDGTPSSISPPPQPPIDDSIPVPPPQRQPSSLPTTEPNAKGPSSPPSPSIHCNNIHESTHSYRNQQLDDSQTDAIRFALQNESPITLIHGPVTFM